MDHMKPFSLVKDVRPSELRSWKLKYDKWFRNSFQGTPLLKLEVDSFLLFLDSWWMSRLQPRVKKDTNVEDLWKWVGEEMKVLYPISRRQDMLFESRQ